jgi:hypothetical protein
VTDKDQERLAELLEEALAILQRNKSSARSGGTGNGPPGDGGG